MTRFKILSAAAILSLTLATPVFAQAAIQEPGAFAFAYPNYDVLNGGQPTPAARMDAIAGYGPFSGSYAYAAPDGKPWKLKLLVTDRAPEWQPPADAPPFDPSRARQEAVLLPPPQISEQQDTNATVTLRAGGRLRHIGIGRTHAGTRVLLLVHDLHTRIIDATTGELLRELTLDLTRDYQPTGKPRRPQPKTP